MIKKDPDLIGEHLGNYKIISKLGKGGMATVYKAHELSLNRVVALKVLSAQLSENTEFIKRFQREAQSAASLNHPNIIQIYYIGEEDDIHFFSMEYIKGKSLAEMIKEDGPMSYEKTIPLIMQVAEALGEAHKIGLIHRDIKPSNIMVDASETVKVTDFGIAYVTQAETKLTREGSIIGTPEYLSPEQCEAKTVDGRSDIYSLGVTLYEILTGKTPYKADTPVSMLMKIVKGNFIPINEVNPDVPRTVQKIVEKMMKTNPGERYQSIDELIDALKVLEKENIPSLVEHTKPFEEPRKKKEGHGVRNFFITLAVLVVVLGGAFAAWYFLTQDKKPDEQTEQVTKTETTTTENAAKTETPSTDESQIQDTSEQTSQNTSTETPAEKTTDPTTKGESTPTEVTTPTTETPAEKPAEISTQKSFPKKQKTTRAKPKPLSNSIIVTAIGDEDKSDIITSYVQSVLLRKEFLVMDGPSTMDKKISDIARFHLIVSSKYMGSTALKYYGNTSQLHTVSISIKIVNPKNGKMISGPFTRTVKYTAINADEKLKDAVEDLTLELQNNLKQKVNY